MSEGKVKWYNERKGFGFIGNDNGGDVFVHHSAIKANGSNILNERKHFSFDVRQVSRGSSAENMKPL
ncbi:MAG TPA: cold shock domain-containing protein [Syntrophales bacterium]|nr:cold shock domain-containing protein [Syntrophales bacterium]